MHKASCTELQADGLQCHHKLSTQSLTRSMRDTQGRQIGGLLNPPNYVTETDEYHGDY